MALAARMWHVNSRVEQCVHEGFVARPRQPIEIAVQGDLDGGGLRIGVHGDVAPSDFWHARDSYEADGTGGGVIPMAGTPSSRRPVTGTPRLTASSATYRRRL